MPCRHESSARKHFLSMSATTRRIVRTGLVLFGRLLARFLFRLTIEGAAHAPRSPHNILVISNHFSWFDAPILSLLLPFPPAYLIAIEAQDKAWIRMLTTIFESIPIWRGQVDRTALTTAVRRLQAGGVVGIFPEGGVNPEMAELIASGQQITQLQGNMSRTDAQLIRAKSGVALLATMSGAQIMPVAIMGSQHLLQNLKRWRRTPLTIRIGPLFGPLTLDATRKGQARRQQMDDLADEMMRQVALLFPPENRGYYADSVTSKS
jgi:1-acyl-sn-glycerol-3-phosphate acyltransferase